MDDLETPQPENVLGPFLINKKCISCSACWEIAPRFIKSHEIHTYAFFYHQPTNSLEKKECILALEICPVDAIQHNQKS